MKKPRHLALAAILLSLLAFFPDHAFARGGFKGGGFRMAPSIRSTSIGRSATAGRSGGGLLSWGSATRPAAGGMTGQATAPTGRYVAPQTRSSVAAQRSLYDSARSSGTLFPGKAQAAQAFRSSYGTQYRSTFPSEPQVRPDWIPGSTYVGERPVNIVYNQGLGGYGYMNPMLGTWMLYDAMADAATMDLLMSRHNYYYGPQSVYLSHGGGFFSLALVLFLGFVLVVVALRALRMARGRW